MSSQEENSEKIANADWIPLRRAVYESFWKHELENGTHLIQLRFTSRFAPLKAELGLSDQTLKFLFWDGSVFEGTPWDFLNKSETLPPHAFAAAFLHKTVGEIWDKMNDAFNRRVSSGGIVLFARMDDFRAQFIPIPADQWSYYRVTDWEKGTALAHDGRSLCSVHAKLVDAKVNTPGRQPFYDQDQINGEVRRAIKSKGLPERGGETGWQSRADVERLVRDFCYRTTGKEPARSTLQILAKEALAAAKGR
ncbi:hypothetical protein ABIB06_007841 [Bradyrhizobium sp. LB8.2]|uniref:hypothetical protein n=1 Tax=unclassified Bradyrhizobium TaxID=2631580 RepID=UPI003392B4B9